ncbi:MAG: PAS domain S-box protein [Pelatocladus maniniholoensis HA4357-MV3]|jgi:two-component system sensor histidine kinase/response regulator|uniref:Circadian input-output histidine kinase CikA n=1 Tax=Pelatocladus maniniholoensis HA4357-MV3 TaxID=1117104 RepID=A0A9E3H9J9_9NOST|nr:PAS domain S-box protein [Pelatocladus maniniholoensis HA4357-MV3]
MSSSNSPQISKGNILVVDDCWEHLQTLSATLSQYGYTVRSLITASMVLEVAKLALPDLILLDIKMPDIDGYEVCQQLKADTITCHIPVIFISVYNDIFDKVKAFKIGAVDYITKPFQIEEVLVRVENQITIQKLQQQLKQQNEQLLLEMQECQRIEADRQLREQYLTALLEVQHRLLSFDNSDKCYQDIMPILGTASKASRVYVFENHHADDGNLLMSQRAEWCSEGINPEIDSPILQNLPYQEYFPRWAALLANGKIISGIVAELPASERAILEPQGILSILILPIITKGEFLGFIGFDNCVESHLWETSEVAFLQAAAGAISIAYEGYQSDLELQKQLERSNLLRKITDEIRSELDQKIIIKTAIKQIGEAFGVSRTLIHTYLDLPTPQIPILEEFLAPECTSFSHCNIPVNGNLHTQQLLAQDRAIAANNVYTHPLLENAQEICREYNIKSTLAVRTSYNGQANGMVCLHQCDRYRNWSLEEIELLESIAAQLGIAIAQAKLLEQEKQARIELEQEIRDRLNAQTALRHSQAKLASAFRSSPDPIALTTFPEVRYIEVNDSFCRFFGYSHSQIIGCNYRELNIWANQEECAMLTQVLRHTKAVRNHEIEFRTASGELKTTLFSAELIEIDGQQYLLGTAHDITERKQAENESRLLLLTTQAISRAVDVDNALALVLRLICTTINWNFGEAWIPTENNTALEYRLGWYGRHNHLDEFCQYSQVIRLEKGMRLLRRVWRKQKPEWIEDISQVTESAVVGFLPQGDATTCEDTSSVSTRSQIGLKAGFAVPILADNQVVAVLVFFKSSSHALDRRLLYLVGAVAAQLGALIQRKQVEAAHRQSEERLQLALKGSDLGLWDWNIKARKVYRDWRWKKMLGYEPHEITDDSCAFAQLLHPEDVEPIKLELNAYLRGESPAYEVEFRLRAKSGEWKWIQSRAQVFEHDESGEPLRMTGTHKDITERKNLERELALREARLNAFFSCVPVGMNILDDQLRYVQINEQLANINGHPQSEHIGKTLWDMVPEVAPFVVPLCEQVLQTAKPILNIEVSAPLPSESDIIRHFLTSYFPIFGEDIHPCGVGTVVVEITDRKHTELALQESQRRYQTLAEASPVGIFHTDHQGKFLYVNQRFSDITGLAAKADLDKYWYGIIHINDRDRVFAQWQATISAKKSFYSEYRFVHSSGRVIWVIGQALPEFGDDGEFKGYIGTVTDITELKLAEDALRESADREKAITQVIQRMRQTLDLATIFTATTQELRQVLNCDRVVVYRFNSDWSGEFVAESVGSGWVSLIEQHQDEPNLTETTLQNERCTIKIISSGDNQVLDTYLQQTQGGIYTRGGSFLCVPDIYTAGFDPCYINLLERFQVRAYITVPIFCGNQLWGLLASYQNSSSRHWKKGEINIVVQIGNQLGVALQQAELLTQTQQQSSALQKAVIAADAANLAKSEFLANMSHELRTPLNAILGFTQIMTRDRTLSSENKQNLAIINRAGEHLLNLINDILEMSKIEAGRTTLTLSSFDLIYLLDNLQEMLHIRATAKGLELVFEYAPEIPRYVRTDSSKLRQVLLNILGNAIKFTETGSVKLRVYLEDEEKVKSDSSQPHKLATHNPRSTDHNTLFLCFEVIDTGTGILVEEIDLLFQAFGQTETGRKSQQGTGLGLAISRKYVQLMGGEINVSSAVGIGSVFSFYIQIAIACVDEIQTTTSVSQQVIGLAPGEPEYRILVVDDAHDSRLLLVKLLASIGFSVKEATNGQEAISVWESWKPNLIFMDMRMPIMDGYEATREIKGRETDAVRGRADMGDTGNINETISTSSSRTVIIALTANAFEEQRQAMISAGCDDFINKPFREELLLEKLAQYLGVKYLFHEENQEEISQNQTNTETILNSLDMVALLSEMSNEWLTQVHYAAAQCSDDLIIKLVKQIPSSKSLLSNFLTDLAENFRFEKIMELIDLANS